MLYRGLEQQAALNFQVPGVRIISEAIVLHNHEAVMWENHICSVFTKILIGCLFRFTFSHTTHSILRATPQWGFSEKPRVN